MKINRWKISLLGFLILIAAISSFAYVSAKGPGNPDTCVTTDECREGWICESGTCVKNQEPKAQDECPTVGVDVPECFDASACTIDGCEKVGGVNKCYHDDMCTADTCCAQSEGACSRIDDDACCKDLTSDPDNCGSCRHVCSTSTPYCVDSNCVECEVDPNCGGGKGCCNNACVTLGTPEHCGTSGCGVACSGTTPDCGGDECVCTADPNSCAGTATPVCDTSSGDCVECLVPGDCPDDGNPCTGVTCTEAHECDYPSLLPGTGCASDTGICCDSTCQVGWSCCDDTQCSSTPTTPSCGSSHSCVCTSSSCTSPNVCDTESGTCVRCNVGTDCSDGNPCTDDVCTNHACSNPPVTNGGTCASGTGICCDSTCRVGWNCCDNTQCSSTPTTPSCDSTHHCVCSGTSCGDGNVCCTGACYAGNCCTAGDCTEDSIACTTKACLSHTCRETNSCPLTGDTPNKVDCCSSGSCKNGCSGCGTGSCCATGSTYCSF
jgi:hypothetical protein